MVALKGQSHPKRALHCTHMLKVKVPAQIANGWIYFLVSLFFTTVNISNGDAEDLIPVSSATYNIEMYFSV